MMFGSYEISGGDPQKMTRLSDKSNVKQASPSEWKKGLEKYKT